MHHAPSREGRRVISFLSLGNRACPKVVVGYSGRRALDWLCLGQQDDSRVGVSRGAANVKPAEVGGPDFRYRSGQP